MNEPSAPTLQQAQPRMYIDESRLDWMLTQVDCAIREGRGLFAHGIEKLVPQYNLPADIGHELHDEPVKDPLAVAKYLWLRITCDKRAVSNRLNPLTRQLWADESLRWIFNYDEVVKHKPQEISEIIGTRLQYRLLDYDANFPHIPHLAGRTIIRNAIRMLKKYDGDPRNIINGQTMDEARRRLQEFRTWGPGIANLYLGEIIDLGIATPIDVENFQPKIDVHKPRVAANLDVIKLGPETQYIYYSELQKKLGPAYRDSARRIKKDMITLDSGIWAIGANICVKNDYHACVAMCPLVNYCTGNAREGRRVALPAKPKANRSAGHLIITNADGTKVDTRKNKGQVEMFPDVHNIKPEQDVSQILAQAQKNNEPTDAVIVQTELEF